MRRMSRQDCILVKIEPDAEIIVKFLIISLVICGKWDRIALYFISMMRSCQNKTNYINRLHNILSLLNR